MVEMNCKKRLLFSLFFLTSISIFIVVTILPGPIINDLVLETHKTLENRLTSYSKNNNLKNERPDEDELDTTYLELLGFNFRPILYNNRSVTIQAFYFVSIDFYIFLIIPFFSSL